MHLSGVEPSKSYSQGSTRSRRQPAKRSSGRRPPTIPPSPPEQAHAFIGIGARRARSPEDRVAARHALSAHRASSRTLEVIQPGFHP